MHAPLPDADTLRALAHDVRTGLGAHPKALPSRWFYDDAGSRLFQAIMALPEYYLSRVEAQLLRRHANALAHWLLGATRAAPGHLIELGSGDGSKVAPLLARVLALAPSTVYRPIDVSATALEALQAHLCKALPSLRVQPQTADYLTQWPPVAAGEAQAVLYLGSNLGNFAHEDALALLQRLRARVVAGDTLLLGVDLQKDPHTVLAAYNDAQGVTAAFNLNLLQRLNRELGMDFAPAQFRHYAGYDPLTGLARSFLVSRCAQVVTSAVLGQGFAFAAGECLCTEQSQKYTRSMLAAMAQASGWRPERSWVDAALPYALCGWRAV